MKVNQLFIGKVIALILVIISIFYVIYEVKDLRNNSKISVAKVYKISHSRYVSRNAHYEYYHDGDKYEGVRRLKDEKAKDILNKFFEVKYSKENPLNSEIDLAAEVKNTNKIKRANFSLE